jgi:hypothetical protein
MCDGCWQEHLEEHDNNPAPVTPQILTAVEAIRNLYEAHPTGGAMHVVTDDWNLDDDSLEFCGQNLSHDEVERSCWQCLSELTEHQRATALAVYDGYLAL